IDRTTTPWATAPGTVDVPKVHARLVDYPSRDGATVRMIVVSQGADADRPRPTILGGYGGFGVSMTPGYSATVLAWVEAGGVYAIANLRGGGEEGEDWHRAGMLGGKQRVFEDFEAAAEWLVAHGWTTRGQLSISGGSNGGLLGGPVLVRRESDVGHGARSVSRSVELSVDALAFTAAWTGLDLLDLA